MESRRFDGPLHRFAAARQSRRTALRRGVGFVGALAAAGRWPRGALAQVATPPGGASLKSLTREAFQTQLVEDLGYTEAATPGGIFLDSSTSDISTLHPFFAEDAISLSITGLIYDGLVGSDVRTGQPAPTGLADWWEIAPDGRTYTFHLNPHATWHDGVAVTAADVQFTFDALANVAVPSSNFLASTESWRAVDATTFEMVAFEPYATFLGDVSVFIIPKHMWEPVPLADWQTDPGATGADPARVVGSGPFRFHERRPGERITLVRNDDYYGKAPYIDTYVVRIWPDQTTVVEALLRGDADVAGLQPADLAGVEGKPGIAVAHYPTRSFTFYAFNLDPAVTTKWQDQRVRQALLYALDREAIVNDILLGYAEVAQGTQPVVSYAYAPEEITTHYTYDPEKAKALLAEAGWTDSDGDGIVDKDGQRLSFELLYSAGSPTSDRIAAFVQEGWAAIGVAMTPRALAFPALVEAFASEHDFEIALLRFAWSATFSQVALFGCNQYQVGFNSMKYCNPEFDAISVEVTRTFDEAKRRELLIEASNIVNDEQPVAVLFFSQAHVAYSDRLQNFAPSTWGVDLTYVWIRQ